MKTKRPRELAIPTPSLKRRDLLRWISTVAFNRGGTDYRYGSSSGPWHFCFNAKLPFVDTSFERLWTAFKRTGYAEDFSGDPERLAQAKARWEGLSPEQQGSWFNMAIEIARDSFVGEYRRNQVDPFAPGDDAFTTLWNGRNVQARYFFGGRSGGWLVLAQFEGMTLDMDLDLCDLDYRTLLRLAELVRFVELAVEDRVARVVEALAFHFLENGCGDIPTHEERCAQWARDQSGEH